MSTEAPAPTQMERLALELLGLPAASRARLAEQLIKSLEHEDYPPEAEVKQRQMEVARQRVADFESGKTQAIPAEDVFREIQEEVE